MNLKSFRDLLIEELRDIYDGEQQLVHAFPLMADAAILPQLKQAFIDHLEQTKTHITRLEKIFLQFGEQPTGNPCKTMQGLIAEAQDIIDLELEADPGVLDAALLGAAQKVEHFEIAAYGTARTYAEILKLNGIASMLQETLDEEGKTNKLLNKLAMHSVNPEAAEATRPGKVLREAVVSVLEATK
ncbi:MAG TPA: ferritin-like domain-containing protein [Verrucomicrobiae bacterium]